MSLFMVDRHHLPKPWARPLIFTLSNGEDAVRVEIEAKSAIEYQSAWLAPGLAIALAPQRTEYFLEAVESATNRLISQQNIPPEPMVISWDDLYP